MEVRVHTCIYIYIHIYMYENTCACAYIYYICNQGPWEVRGHDRKKAQRDASCMSHVRYEQDTALAMDAAFPIGFRFLVQTCVRSMNKQSGRWPSPAAGVRGYGRAFKHAGPSARFHSFARHVLLSSFPISSLAVMLCKAKTSRYTCLGSLQPAT